jgi:hypothetical protein
MANENRLVRDVIVIEVPACFIMCSIRDSTVSSFFDWFNVSTSTYMSSTPIPNKTKGRISVRPLTSSPKYVPSPIASIYAKPIEITPDIARAARDRRG